jgi:hypothetical protein
LLSIGVAPKFNEEIEHPRRHRPAERQMAAELGAGVIGDELGAGVRPIRRPTAEFITPSPDKAAGTQFERHQTDRLGALAVAAVAGPEFKIN